MSDKEIVLERFGFEFWVLESCSLIIWRLVNVTELMMRYDMLAKNHVAYYYGCSWLGIVSTIVFT